MGRQLVASVPVRNADGAVVVLAAGSEVPDWAKDQITNDAVYGEPEAAPEGDFVTVEAASDVDGDSGAPFGDAAVAAGAVDYSAMKVADLRQLAGERGIATDGVSKADLVAALDASD